jgi:hypothetical protein
MTTFKQFISEASAFELEKFKKDCAFYLNQIKNTGGKHLLYRGGKDWPDNWAIRKWAERIIPRNTPIVAHDLINDYLQKEYGHEFRNWMFCTGDRQQADIYSGRGGHVCAIFPIGKVEWFCGLIWDMRDLTGWLNSLSDEIYMADKERKISYDERYQLAATHVINVMKDNKHKLLFNEDFTRCINSYHEIMFKCNSYYAFNIDGDTFNSKEFKDFLTSI